MRLLSPRLVRTNADLGSLQVEHAGTSRLGSTATTPCRIGSSSISSSPISSPPTTKATSRSFHSGSAADTFADRRAAPSQGLQLGEERPHESLCEREPTWHPHHHSPVRKRGRRRSPPHRLRYVSPPSPLEPKLTSISQPTATFASSATTSPSRKSVSSRRSRGSRRRSQRPRPTSTPVSSSNGNKVAARSSSAGTSSTSASGTRRAR